MRIFIVAASTLALAACAPMHGFSDPSSPRELALVDEDSTAADCRGEGAGSNRDSCTILVNVSVSGSACTISVGSGQGTVVFRKNEPRLRVLWQLDSRPSRYRFADNGIEFKDDTDGNFVGCRRLANGQLFRCINSNGPQDAKEYEYGINIVGPAGTRPCHLDPKIANR